jgi:hypothetical protein
MENSPLNEPNGKCPRPNPVPEDDYSTSVRKKLSGSSRTGQACDRCKVCTPSPSSLCLVASRIAAQGIALLLQSAHLSESGCRVRPHPSSISSYFLLLGTLVEELGLSSMRSLQYSIVPCPTFLPLSMLPSAWYSLHGPVLTGQSSGPQDTMRPYYQRLHTVPHCSDTMQND